MLGTGDTPAQVEPEACWHARALEQALFRASSGSWPHRPASSIFGQAAYPRQSQSVRGIKAFPSMNSIAVWGLQDGQGDAHPVQEAQHQDQQRPRSVPNSSCNCPVGPPGNSNALNTHLTCAGSARVSGPCWSRGIPHRRQGVPGSTGTGNRRRLTR